MKKEKHIKTDERVLIIKNKKMAAAAAFTCRDNIERVRQNNENGIMKME